MSIEPTEFRQAVGQFASGVTVITTAHQEQLHGTTVSAFSSLSLSPPLILVNIDRSATIHDLIIESEIFGVNILSEQAEALSQHFARRIPNKFVHIPYYTDQLGVPLLEEAIARLECRLVAHYPGGDHSIFVGEVISSSVEPQAQPLLHFRGKYNRLSSNVAV